MTTRRGLDEARAWLAEVSGWAAEWRPEDMNVRVHPQWLARKLTEVRRRALADALDCIYPDDNNPDLAVARIRSLMEPQEKDR